MSAKVFRVIHLISQFVFLCSGKLNGSPPTPPPVPGRPPSFRKTNEARPSIQPPPPAIFPAGSSQQAPVVHQAPYRAGGPIAPQPPPSASTTTLPFSASLHSLPGSPASAQRPGPPRRHDSLNSVLQQQQIDHTLRNVPQKTVQSPQPPRQPKMTLAQGKNAVDLVCEFYLSITGVLG